MDGAVYESIILPFVLFVIASSLSSVLNVLGIVTDLMGTGIASVQSSAQRLSNSGIDKYDGKMIDGSSVKAAVGDFGKTNQMAVLIWNKGFDGTSKEPKVFVNYAYLLDGNEEGSGIYEFGGSKYKTIKADTSDGYTGGVHKPENSSYWKGSRKVEADGIQPSFLEMRATNQKTSAMYVSTISTYYAQLIRDSRGDVIGAVFIEQ